jgi:hypothetical protein
MLGAGRGAKLAVQHDNETPGDFGLMTFGRSPLKQNPGIAEVADVM